MWSSIKTGWNAALRQPFVYLTLFVYRLIWGLVLYSMANSVVLPLMERFPGQGTDRRQLQLFLAEGQFQLFKTDISHSYLWMLLFLLLARMLLTPLLNAGVLFSLRHEDLNSGYRFFKGIKTHGKAFFFIYLLQMVLTLSPLLYLWPLMKDSFLNHGSYQSALLHLTPYVLGWFAYGYLIGLLFLHLLFGQVWERGFGASFGSAVRNFLPSIGIALALLLLTALLTAGVLTGTYVWAGFWALMAYQAFRLVDTFLSFWNISSQHELYFNKSL